MGITPDVTLDATLNPDFSQIEADIAQSAVNTSFVLFFPERRPFFLEGQDFFNTQLNLVNTRNLGDPEYGAKVTGKVGGNVYGLFTARDRVTNFLIAGSQGSRTTQLDQEHQTSVARYRRDFRDSSSVGVLLTDRWGDDYRNQVVSVDGRYRLTSTDTVQVQLVHSRSENPEELITEFGVNRKTRDHAYRFSYNHFASRWLWGLVHSVIGNDFRADAGFINQTDVRSTGANLGYQWRGQPGSFVSNVNISGQLNETETNDAGDLLSRGGGVFVNISLPLTKYLDGLQPHRSRTGV